MTPQTIIQKAKADGVALTLAPAGKVKLSGPDRLVARWLPVIREHKAAIVAALGDHHPTHADITETVQEAMEERAAIMEYDGGLPRERAKTQAKAKAAMRVFEYKLTDSQRWLAMLAPGRDLAQAERSLMDRFGGRLVAVREWKP